jgi:TonB family protein
MQDINSQPARPENTSTSQSPAAARTTPPLTVPQVSLLLEWEPWHQAFFRRVREFIRPEKLPPLKLTSKPVAVKDMWSDYKKNRMATETSVLLHVVIIALIIIPFGKKAVDIVKREVIYMPDLSPYELPLPPADTKAGGGGGGGDRSPEPASKGELPKLSMQQLSPPVVILRNPQPKLPVAPTVVVPPEIPIPTTVDVARLGDPLGRISFPSSGTGFGGGIGDGSGGGVGSGRGGGVGPGEGGGIGGGVFRVGGGVSAPEVIYQVTPDYSEQARKSKYQGTVVLSLVVQKDGTVRDIRVTTSLGMGLDEKAIEAVKQWRFRPGMKGGQPVDVSAMIEVTFRLL